MAKDFPILNLADFKSDETFRREAFIRDLDRACRDLGFFFLIGHGLDDTLNTCFRAAQDFFNLPICEKEKISISKSSCHRGWYRLHEEILDPIQNAAGDYKEGLKIGFDCPPDHPRIKAGVPLHGANQWPDIEGWQAVMQHNYNLLSDLSRELMQALALALVLPADYFADYLTDPMATLSPLRYPPQQGEVLGAGAHTDFGCLSLVAQLDADGLEIKTRDGDWLPVPFYPDALAVNLGDMMARWTNDLYRSPPHRVINRQPHHRHSLAFFFDPDPETDLSAFPSCLAETGAAHYPPATCLEHLLSKIDESFSYRKEVE